VHAGQVPVKHHHVIAGAVKTAKRLMPVPGEVHGHALTTQSGGDRRRKHIVILYDKHPHPYQHARATVTARCHPLAPC
jgi:hypothetical protein